MLDPAFRALAQLDDPALLRPVLHGVAWSALAFVLLGGGIGWWVHDALTQADWLGPVLGVIAAILAAMFLFLPLATAIAALFVDGVAAAVEHRWYPWLPEAAPAPLGEQVIDGLALGFRVLLLQCVALLLAIFLPGIGLILGWAISAWAIGRGLFVTVAMRRLDRRSALAAWRANRLPALAQGALIAAAGLVPLVNLFAVVLGTAAMVHVLHGRRVVTPGPA
jgi:CysZ protein